MADMDMKALDALDNLYTQAKDVESESFENLPDGVYVGVATEVKMKMTAKGKPQIAITLKERESGRLNWLNLFLTSNDPTKNAQAMARARGTLEKLGATPAPTFKELVVSAQENIVGATIKYTLETRNDYQNVNQFKLELLESKEQAPAGSDTFGGGTEIDISDDDFPF